MNENDQQPPFIPAWMRDQNWSPHQWAIYCYIASRGECWATKRTMAKELKMTRDTLVRELEDLVKCGWIQETNNGPRSPKTYRAKTGGKPVVRLRRRSRKYKTWPHERPSKLENPAQNSSQHGPPWGQHMAPPKANTWPPEGPLKCTNKSKPIKEEAEDPLAKVKECLDQGDLRSALYFGGKNLRGGKRDC